MATRKWAIIRTPFCPLISNSNHFSILIILERESPSKKFFFFLKSKFSCCWSRFNLNGDENEGRVVEEAIVKQEIGKIHEGTERKALHNEEMCSYASLLAWLNFFSKLIRFSELLCMYECIHPQERILLSVSFFLGLNFTVILSSIYCKYLSYHHFPSLVRSWVFFHLCMVFFSYFSSVVLSFLIWWWLW